MNEIPIDRLNDLPDSLLIHILSFLTVKEAAVTCVLSKRWRFLWSNLPRLELWESEKFHRFPALEKTRRFVAWVNRLLAVRTTNSLHKFSVRMQYHRSYDSDIDNWICYAVRNRVKTLTLMIHSRYIHDYYTLPEATYSCSSLEYLFIQGQFVIGAFGKTNWGRLTELYLECVDLDQEFIDDILTECPVLHRFELRRCFGYSRLEVRSPSLRLLAVEDSDDESPRPLQITAPYLQFLDISISPDERLLKLEGIDSLCKARLDYILHGFNPDEIMSYTKGLLKYTDYVVELHLKRKFFEVISMLAVTGCRLPQSTRCRLEVSSSVAFMYNVSGIIALLESSPNLETLVLESFNTDVNYAFPDPVAKGDLDCNLSRLKNIYFTNFTALNGEPMLTLARILLKRAPVLESMEIVIDGVKSSNDYNRIHKELLFLPRVVAIFSEIHQYQSRSRYEAKVIVCSAV